MFIWKMLGKMHKNGIIALFNELINKEHLEHIILYTNGSGK